jgi:CheY-like chemotaxis protein
MPPVYAKNSSISIQHEMTTEKVEQELRDALAHLYDPNYQPSEILCELTGCDQREGALAVQSAMIRAIEDLTPSPNASPNSPTNQIHALLHNRFVQKLTLEETAKRMHMSLSSTCRTQRTAVHALARILWEHRQAAGQLPEKQAQENGRQLSDEAGVNARAIDWRAQAKRELASLLASAPDVVSDVGETIHGALELMAPLISKLGVRVEVGFVQPDLVATIHPSVLRQLLITAIGRLARYTSTGQLTIYAGREGGNAKITIVSDISAENRPTEGDLIADMVALENIVVEANIDGDHVSLGVEVPSVGKTTVLVVDDNLDMARFYRRCSEGTRYHIVHMAQGQGLFETVKVVGPDIIVLDVMLPDIDGWDLLMRLHEDPATRSTPIIICTVVKEEDLALSLGATCYLTKPVRPREFIQALDQLLLRA